MADQIIRDVVIRVSVQPKDTDLGAIAQKINDLDKQKAKAQKQQKQAADDFEQVQKRIQTAINLEAKDRFKQIQLAERLAVIERQRTVELQKQAESRRKELAESIKGAIGKIGKGGEFGAAVTGGITLGMMQLDQLTDHLEQFNKGLEKGVESLDIFQKGLKFNEQGALAVKNLNREAPDLVAGIFGAIFGGLGGKAAEMVGGAAPKPKQGVFLNGQKVNAEDERLKNLKIIDQYERDHIAILKERNKAELDLIATEKKKIEDFELAFGLMNREQQNQVKEIDAKIQAGGLSSLNKEELDLARQLHLDQFKGNQDAIRQNAVQGGVYDLSFIKDSMKAIADAQAKLAIAAAEGKKEFNLNQTIDVIIHGLEGDFKSSVKKELSELIENKVQAEFRKAMQAINNPGAF